MTDRARLGRAPQIWAGRITILAAFFFLWEPAPATQIHRPDPDRPAERHRRVSVAGDFRHRQPHQGSRLDHARHVSSLPDRQRSRHLVGMLFVDQRRPRALLEPILIALNAMPRIALAPLFLIWFGLGLGSKIAIGFSLTFFIVLSSTVAGGRGVNPDHIMLARTLGASGRSSSANSSCPAPSRSSSRAAARV